MSDRNRRIRALSVIALLLLWEAASLVAGSEHLLPGPWKTLESTVALFCNLSFLKVVGCTLLRAAAGFVLAFAAGVAMGITGGLSDAVNSFIHPWVVVIRSTPVIAFVLLAIIWFSSDTVPIFIGMLTMFPIIYMNVSEGIRSVDGKLVEMARFHGIAGRRLVKELYLPAIRPFVTSGLSTAVGIGWRAIVVGEVMSQPEWGIGTVMNSARTFLQVDILIAWTLVAVLLGALFEIIIRHGHRS